MILCDTGGLGAMVTSANVGDLRRWNFGARVLQRPLSAESIAEEMQRYDASDAAEVSRYIRGNAGLENAVEQYLTLYRAVLDAPPAASADADWHPATAPLQIEDQALLRLRYLTVPQSVAPGRNFTVDVGLFNGTTVPIASAVPWPCLLMYRWLNARTGLMVVEHGVRTIIQPPAWPGEETFYSMRAIAPNEPGDYLLRVTMIQEGWRWLDSLAPAVCAESPVTIAPEMPVQEVCHETI